MELMYERVKVPRVDDPRFCGRKDYPMQNVFATCNFNMKFTHILVDGKEQRMPLSKRIH